MGAGYFAAKKNIYPACWLTSAPEAEALRLAAVGRVSSLRWPLGLSAVMAMIWICSGRASPWCVPTERLEGAQCTCGTFCITEF